MNGYVVLADVVLVLHFAYLVFIPLGGMLAIRWRRLIWPHLAAVAIGVVSITVRFDCPLTTWEQSLRRRGGQHSYTDGFVAHYLTGRIYPHGYAWAVQALFAACVVASYSVIYARPHVRWRRAGSSGAGS
jgi:hypothetical protein